jgi:hypothetical protein
MKGIFILNKRLADINRKLSISWYPVSWAISVCFLLLYLLWIIYCAPRLGYDSIQWTLSAIAQTSATLLGLTIVAHIFTTERADKSVDYLRDVKKIFIKRLGKILDSTIKNIIYYISSSRDKLVDLSDMDVLHSLLVMKMSIDMEYYPAKESLTILLSKVKDISQDTCDDLRAELLDEATIAKNATQIFIDHFGKASFYISQISDFPNKNLFDEFLEYYKENIDDHMMVINNIEWLRGPNGKGLLSLLGLTLIVSLGLLSICNRLINIIYLTRGLALLFFLLLLDIILVARIFDWLFL